MWHVNEFIHDHVAGRLARMNMWFVWHQNLCCLLLVVCIRGYVEETMRFSLPFGHTARYISLSTLQLEFLSTKTFLTKSSLSLYSRPESGARRSQGRAAPPGRRDLGSETPYGGVLESRAWRAPCSGSRLILHEAGSPLSARWAQPG